MQNFSKLLQCQTKYSTQMKLINHNPNLGKLFRPGVLKVGGANDLVIVLVKRT